MVSRLRTKLLPPGSRRARFLWVTKLAILKMREGPIPWLRAVRRGLFGLLPARIQIFLAARLRGRSPARGLSGRARPDAGPEIAGRASVVLPVFNQASLLAESIDSVLAQTYADFELIVVNDGSTDGVEAVLDRYADDPRVRVLMQENQLLARALSNGFDFASGEFRTWTSADNVMEPLQLERLVAFLRAHPDVAMVYADYVVIDADGAPLPDSDFRPQDRRHGSAEVRIPRDTTQLNVLLDNFIGACFLYRGWVGRLLGDYNPVHGLEDYDYWMRVNRLFRIEHLGTDELLYRYRWHGNSLNARSRELRLFELGQELMGYERSRGDFFAQPWRILADRQNECWVRDLGLEHEVASPAGGGPPAEKALRVIGPDALAEDDREHDGDVAVAVVFGAKDDPYAVRDRLPQPNRIHFAPDATTLARLSLFTTQAYELRPGRPLLDMALAHGNNHLFRSRTQDPSADRRDLPRVRLAGGRRSRVLLQADDFLQGGLEQIVLDLATWLARDGMEAALLVLGRQGEDARRAREMGIDVVTLPGKSHDHYARLLAERRIDLVSAHYSLYGAGVAHAAGLPFVQTIHNTYVWLTPEQILDHHAADEYTTCYVPVSATVAQYSDHRLGLPPSKMVIVPNGVEPGRADTAVPPGAADALRDELDLRPEDFVFVNAASVMRHKAQRIAVHALALARERFPDVRIVFSGGVSEPHYMDLLRSEAKQLGVEDAVRFAGYRADVRAVYAMADAFLLPSYWEGCSVALAEAMAAGLPVVATDVGAAREQVPGGAGVLVRPPYGEVTNLDSGNIGSYIGVVQPEFVSALADAIGEVRDAAPAMAAAARRAPRHDAEKACTAYARLFEWLIAGGGPAEARPWVREIYAREEQPASSAR